MIRFWREMSPANKAEVTASFAVAIFLTLLLVLEWLMS